MFFNSIMISISLSIDALGIGVAYGVKGVRITKLAKVIIALLSAGIMWAALAIGTYIKDIFPGDVTNLIGVAILILMGVIYIRNSLFSDENASYDFDKSSRIEGFEGAILGFALSADSLSAGIAIASMGMGSFLIPIGVGIMQVLFLTVGEYAIRKTNAVKKINSKVCGVFSGFILILIALLRI